MIGMELELDLELDLDLEHFKYLGVNPLRFKTLCLQIAIALLNGLPFCFTLN